MTAHPRWTPHRSTTWAGVRPRAAAMPVTTGSTSTDSSGRAIPNGKYDGAPSGEKAVTAIPSDWQKRTCRS